MLGVFAAEPEIFEESQGDNVLDVYLPQRLSGAEVGGTCGTRRATRPGQYTRTPVFTTIKIHIFKKKIEYE
jgi:hypothetical protein